MKRIFLLTAALLALPTWAAATALPRAPKIDLPNNVEFVSKGSTIVGAPEVWKFKFGNGMRVLVLPDDRNPVATFRIRFDAGSDREQKGQTGLAHFFEHMMFRKTKFTEEGHYSKYLGAVGGSGNAGTSSDYVVFYSHFPAPALEKVMEMEAQRVMGLDLVDPYFTTEKGAVISERALNYDNAPANRGREVLRALTERGTPYEWLTIGARDDVANMKVTDAQKFYNDYFTPDNAIVTVGGPVDVSTALKLVNTHFGKWEGKLTKQRRPLPKDYTTRDAGKSFVCSEDVGEQTYTLVYPALGKDYRTALMSDVVSELLDDTPEGKLERRFIRQKLVTKFGFYKNTWERFSQPSQAVFVLNKDQKFDAARKAWLAAVDEALKRPLTERFRKRLLKRLAVSEADLSLKMTNLADNYEQSEYAWGDFLIDRNTRTIYQSVKQEDVKKWIRENLDPARAYVTGIVPKGMAQPCSELAKAK